MADVIYIIKIGNKGYIGQDSTASLNMKEPKGLKRIYDHMACAYEWTKKTDGPAEALRKIGFSNAKFFYRTDPNFGIDPKVLASFFHYWSASDPTHANMEFAEVYYIYKAGGPGRHTTGGLASENSDHGSQKGFDLKTKNVLNDFFKGYISDQLIKEWSKVQLHWTAKFVKNADINLLIHPEDALLQKIFVESVIKELIQEILTPTEQNQKQLLEIFYDCILNQLSTTGIVYYKKINEILSKLVIKKIKKIVKDKIDYYNNKVFNNLGYKIVYRENFNNFKQTIIKKMDNVFKIIFNGIRKSLVNSAKYISLKKLQITNIEDLQTLLKSTVNNISIEMLDFDVVFKSQTIFYSFKLEKKNSEQKIKNLNPKIIPWWEGKINILNGFNSAQNFVKFHAYNKFISIVEPIRDKRIKELEKSNEYWTHIIPFLPIMNLYWKNGDKKLKEKAYRELTALFLVKNAKPSLKMSKIRVLPKLATYQELSNY